MIVAFESNRTNKKVEKSLMKNNNKVLPSATSEMEQLTHIKSVLT